MIGLDKISAGLTMFTYLLHLSRIKMKGLSIFGYRHVLADTEPPIADAISVLQSSD